jgi:dienelactone hydrolase
VNGRSRALALAAIFVALVGLSLGGVAAFASSPVTLLLVLCALSVRGPLTSDHPRRLVGAAAVTALLGVGFVFGGSAAAGAATFALGGAIAVWASRVALAFDAPPAGITVASTSGQARTAAVVLDEAVKLWWEVARVAQRPSDIQVVAADVRAAADRNHERGWIDHPERSHLRPPPLEKAGVRCTRIRGAGSAEHLTFVSEFEPQDPEIRSSYLAQRPNRTAHAYLWRHRGGMRPTLICIHDYAMGHVTLDARICNVQWLHRELGLDVALAVLPLHGLRATGRRSGAGFLDGHPLWTSAALSQSIWDLRRIWGWLRAEGASPTGLLGFGVGGCVASVLASVDEGFACAVPVRPAVPLEHLASRLLPPVRRVERRAAGLGEQLLRQAWAPNAPLRMRPRVPHESRLIIGGASDRIVPPADVEALWEHWGRPAMHWSPGSHFGWIDRSATRARLASHLRGALWRTAVD